MLLANEMICVLRSAMQAHLADSAEVTGISRFPVVHWVWNWFIPFGIGILSFVGPHGVPIPVIVAGPPAIGPHIGSIDGALPQALTIRYMVFSH